MPESQSSLNHFGIMHSDDKSISIVPDIENYKTRRVVCIGETCPEFYKIPPSRCLYDFDPGGNVCLGLLVVFSGLLQTLDRDYVHYSRILRKLRSVNGHPQSSAH